ncbi:MAG: glycosyltransferase family protein [Planctomycetota bacterium]|jgi:hypothetical protein
MQNRIIVSGVNDNPHYMNCMRVMVSSMAKTNPKQRMMLCLINCTPKYEKELFRRNKNISVAHVSVRDSGAIKRINIMHGFVLNALDCADRVMWLDNDIIVRRPITNIWNRVGENTIRIWWKNNDKISHKFQAGVYVVGNGEEIKEWMREIMRRESIYIGLEGSKEDGHGSQFWMTSQALMYTIFTEKDKMQHVQLSEKYNDCKFRKDSVIWHCKSSHFKDRKFQKEFRRYL